MEQAMEILAEAWAALRLSVRCPARAPFWDSILLTAASPEQAELFQWHLEQVKRQEIVPARTLVMAVPDPGGHRVGSGAATLCAISSLAQRLEMEGGKWEGRSMGEMRVLLLHTGGDSKRAPWANAIGKAFMPLPFLAHNDPDGPIYTLFHHILAISTQAVPTFQEKGGLFIMTGDVLPCFRVSAMSLHDNGVCVVTVPAGVDLAAKHGVIVSQFLPNQESVLVGSVAKVEDLLQKPSIDELVLKGAVRPSGDVLLDTGIFALRGEAWTSLIGFALFKPDPVIEVMASGQELSLYEELAGAWVPARHSWLRSRPLGKKLIGALGGNQLHHFCARDLTFLHFGTSTEILDHLAEDQSGRLGRRHLSLFPAISSCKLASSAVIIASEIGVGVSVGEESLVYNCSLGDGVHIGSRCIVMGLRVEVQSFTKKASNTGKSSKTLLDLPTYTGGEFADHGDFSEVLAFWEEGVITIPDNCCLWEAPLKGSTGNRVTVCCGIKDNPKAVFGSPGSGFCGKPWDTFLLHMGIKQEDIWGPSSSKDLWSAQLFPVGAPAERTFISLWLMGVTQATAESSHDVTEAWQKCTRVSLADLHGQIDFGKLFHESISHHSQLAAGLAKASIDDGMMERDFSQLCQRILDPGTFDGSQSGISVCKDLLSSCRLLAADSTHGLSTSKVKQMAGNSVPSSRLYQVQADVLRAAGEEDSAAVLEWKARQAITEETAAAVQYHSDAESPLRTCESCSIDSGLGSCSVSLPVRLDITGGWSDTPPWSLERKGRVLNMAVLLDGAAPVGATVSIRQLPGILLSDDEGNREEIEDIGSISQPFKEDDPFRLVKAALIVTAFAGIHGQTALSAGPGLVIQTWANVPRGSGLGTSSILAAAVVKSLVKLRGREACDSREHITRLVLVLEQLMGTGGGWQDQIGGLYPGVKCTTGIPGQPLLELSVEPISLSHTVKAALQQRMVVAFTGQVRLAVTVLERVVHRYLQRDSTLIHTIETLTELARVGQDCLVSGDLDMLGKIMTRTWKLNQELDPNCSNYFVDTLFRKVDHLTCGYKLAGAGGGGFAILMAKNNVAAESLKSKLREFGHPVQVHQWTLV